MISIPLDKQAHFLIGYAVAITLGLYSIILGLLVAIIMGAGKEWYDYLNQDKHTPDVNDFIATALGGIVASTILYFI